MPYKMPKHANWFTPLAIKIIPLALTFAAGLARGGMLLPCTDTGLPQEQQSNCIVANPGGHQVVTSSYTNSPTFVNTPVSATVNQYQTTLTALLNGSTIVLQQSFTAPSSDPSVQNAISLADGLLSSDGATFGSPLLTSNSTTLQSSVLSYVTTSPTLDTPTLIGCFGASNTTTTTQTCSGVLVTDTVTDTVTFGPATIMIGLDNSDQFGVLAGQEDINVNNVFTYNVSQNAITTNTFLTTQSYQINGTTAASNAPEPASSALTIAGIAAVWLWRRRETIRGGT